MIPKEWIEQWTQMMQADARIMDKEEHNEHLQHRYEAALQQKIKAREELIFSLKNTGLDLMKQVENLTEKNQKLEAKVKELEQRIEDLWDWIPSSS